MLQSWFAIWVLALVMAGEAGQSLQHFRRLEEAQRNSSGETAITKAWLDEAARLATLAADHIERGQYEDAAKLLRATERALGHAPSWNNLRGYAEFKLGNAKSALHYLQRALHLDPESEDYLLDVGEFLGHHRAYEEAVRVFEVAAKRLPKSPRVTFGLAVSYVLQNRRDEAQRLLESLVTAHPRFEAAYKALGECYEDAGNTKGMVALGQTLQRINSRNPLGWYLEGAASLHEARTATAPSLDRAVTVLRRSLALHPSNARAHFVLAKALQENGADDEAIAELKETLRIDPDHERAHYVLARLYQKKGEAERARLEFEKHRQIKEHDRTAQYRRLLISMRDEGEGVQP